MNLREIAEWANKQSETTNLDLRKAFNYLGHWALIAEAQIVKGGDYGCNGESCIYTPE